MIRVTTEGEPRRHQVTEIPEINPHTTEYPCPQVVCEHCQKTTQEPLPEEVRGNFGPHLTALIAYWTVVCRVPRRLVEAMLADVLGLEISAVKCRSEEHTSELQSRGQLVCRLLLE